VDRCDGKADGDADAEGEAVGDAVGDSVGDGLGASVGTDGVGSGDGAGAPTGSAPHPTTRARHNPPRTRTHVLTGALIGLSYRGHPQHPRQHSLCPGHKVIYM
jgi:hypothetical protein